MMLEFKEQGGWQVDWIDKAHCILLVNRWLKAMASLLNAEAGCIVLNDARASRVIARHNIPHAFMTTSVTVRSAPYRADETQVVRDASNRPELHAFLGALALRRTGFFYRRPLSIDGDKVISLVLFAESPQPDLAERELALAGEIADQMAEELERYYPKGSSDLSSSMRMTLAEIERWMAKADQPTAMLDCGLNLRGVNDRMRDLVPVDWSALIGRHISVLKVPARSSVEFLFRRAIEIRVSTPRMDVALDDEEGDGLPRMVRLLGSPIEPVDSEVVLIATIDPSRTEEAPLPNAADLARRKDNATSDFLLETLVQRRALRSRRDVSYVTLRSWRNPIRAHQISALKAIKRHAPAAIASEIAGEMADDVRSLFGAGGFRAVVPMPCGHSGHENCLSVVIARQLGQALELPVAHALALHSEKGSSHPRTNVKRPAMRLVTPVDGPVLLVDDVATSGQHIEEATMLLRGHGASVLAMAWIGGDAGKDDT